MRGFLLLDGAVRRFIWGGVPAKCIKTLPPVTAPVHEAACSARTEEAAASPTPANRALV